jgi:hypothetical protein
VNVEGRSGAIWELILNASKIRSVMSRLKHPMQTDVSPGGGQEIAFPIQYSSLGAILLPVQLNGRTVMFLLDTGCQYTCIQKDLMHDLGLISETAPLCPEYCSIANVKLADRDFEDVIMAVEPKPIHPGCGGILGENVLKHFRVIVDFDKQQVIFSEPTRPPTTSPGTEAIHFTQMRDLPVASIELDGHRMLALLDSGAQFSMVSEGYARRNGVFRPRTSGFIQGSGPCVGSMKGSLEQFKELKLQAVRIEAPVLIVTDRPCVSGIQDMLVLGLEFFRRFKRVTFDYGSNQAFFE